ncbi:MAG: hypothetical protein KDD89_14245, partial [Anaerolineales bacterium]|nr:hypothetical protein [Anaerolineales bacterium]
NWQASDSAPDLVGLVTAVVSTDHGNIVASGPTSIPAGQPFTVNLNWHKENLVPGNHAYGAVVLGTDAAHPDNVGLINLDLVYTGAAQLSLSHEAVEISQAVDGVQTYTLTINNPGDIDLDWRVSREATASRVALDLAEVEEEATGATPANIANPSVVATPFSWVTHARATTTTASAVPLKPTGGQSIALTLDDGAPETSFGASGQQFIWLNRFTPQKDDYPFALTEVQVLFDDSEFSATQVGELVDIYVYQDADGNPNTGAVLAGSLLDAPVQFVDGVQFSTYAFAQPLRLMGPGDVLIAVVNRTAGIVRGGYPAALDATSSRQRSWIGMYSAGAPANPPQIPADMDWGMVDSFGAPGNWLVRGYGEKCGAENISWLEIAPDSGTAVPGGQSDVVLTVDTAGLAEGAYTAVLCLDSNAITTNDEPFIRVPVTLTVTVAPPVPSNDTFLPLIMR